MSTNGEIQAARERAEKATKAPWHQSPHSIERDYVFDPDNDPVAVARTRQGNAGAFRRNEANADFIAHAREDIPMLCEALAEAQRKNEDIAGANLDLNGEMQRLRDELAEAEGKLEEVKEAARWFSRHPGHSVSDHTERHKRLDAIRACDAARRRYRRERGSE